MPTLDVAIDQQVLALQTRVLDQLMSDAVAQRLLDSEAKVADPKRGAAPRPSSTTTLQAAIWSELKTGGDITLIRRNLQREYLRVVATALLRPAATMPADARALLREDARRLRARARGGAGAARVLDGGAGAPRRSARHARRSAEGADRAAGRLKRRAMRGRPGDGRTAATAGRRIARAESLALAARQPRAREPVRPARREPAPDRGGARRRDRAARRRFTLAGAPRADAARGAQALRRFYEQAEKPLSVDDIQLGLIEIATQRAPKPAAPATTRRRCCARAAPICTAARRTRRTTCKHIQEHDITFGIGPAGTGKTYLAVACAVDALERDAVKRIVLVRPAVEAGERLGFLPGDLAQKVDPYLRPLYDALYDLMGFDKDRQALRARHDRDRAARLHARPHAQPLVHHPRRGAEHDARADEDVPHAHRLRHQGGDHRRRHADRPRARPEERARRGASASSPACAASRSRASPAPTSCAIRWCRRSSTPTSATPRAEQAATPATADAARRPGSRSRVQYAVARDARCRRAATLRRWARAALARDATVTLRFVGAARRPRAQPRLPRQGLRDQRAHVRVR